ncbi:MAG: hypothetical protein QOF62_3363 [Pyrinomonadaceae bacterium]|jgi:hypothetical protein|nr:hypothetical protein [Pyrinomonadaceae bacterium]
MFEAQRIISGLRRKLELGDLFIFLYLSVFARQYLWVIAHNRTAWALTVGIAALFWLVHLRAKDEVEERTPGAFWLIVALPLLVVYTLKYAFPDLSVDVLNHRLIQAERGLNGPLFIPGDFFPTIFPFNPSSDMLTGISRHLLGYRLGTVINFLSLLFAGTVLNKLLRPFIVNDRWRCLGILLTLYTEHVLFEINNYMVDLLALPLLLEATRLALREDDDDNHVTRDLVYVALLLGACVAFKLTNVLMAAPIALLFGWRMLRRLRRLDFKVFGRVVMAVLIAALPLVPYTIYIYRQTGSPVFPLYNKLVASPYWPEMNIYEGRFGPENFWQTIVWPVLMFFKPQRLAELPVYSGRLTVGFIAALLCLVLPRIDRRIRMVSLLIVTGSLLWSAAVGYIRYALFLELLSGIVLIYLASLLATKATLLSRPVRLTLLLFLTIVIAAQFLAASNYAYNYEWSMRPTFFEQRQPYLADARLTLRDRHLIDFLASEDKDLIAGVDVWVVSNIKTNGIEVLLRNDVPMLAVNNLPYFDTVQSRKRFAEALNQVQGRRMFSLSLVENLNESLDLIKRRGLRTGKITPITVPFFSNYTRLYMALIEVFAEPKPPPPHRAGPEPTISEVHAPLFEEAFNAVITMPQPPERLHAGEKQTIQVVVRNASDYLWPARGEAGGKFFLNAGDIWLYAGTEELVNNLDGRTTIPHDIYPGEAIQLPLQITAPTTAGEYVLEIDMVQEGVGWFKDKGSTPLKVRIRVE